MHRFGLRNGSFKPDILAWAGRNNVPIAVEVAVIHFVDEVKQKKIEEELATVEIDLSRWLKIDNDQFNRQEFTEDIISKIYNKKWIYNRKLTKIRKIFLNDIRNIVIEKAHKERKVYIERKIYEFKVRKRLQERESLKISIQSYTSQEYMRTL